MNVCGDLVSKRSVTFHRLLSLALSHAFNMVVLIVSSPLFRPWFYGIGGLRHSEDRHGIMAEQRRMDTA